MSVTIERVVEQLASEYNVAFAVVKLTEISAVGRPGLLKLSTARSCTEPAHTFGFVFKKLGEKARPVTVAAVMFSSCESPTMTGFEIDSVSIPETELLKKKVAAELPVNIVRVVSGVEQEASLKYIKFAEVKKKERSMSAAFGAPVES